ncbi:hypothetical protein HDE_13776 [Halotydeus destructor]|nr:hypothetical protein HDE_13776 [Halotydeus destructor]
MVAPTVDNGQHDLDPKDFAIRCGYLIAAFFGLLMLTGLASCLGAKQPPKILCTISILYFIASTIYIMVGMVQSFEIARKKFDRRN